MSLKQAWRRPSTAKFKRRPHAGLASMNVKQYSPASSVTDAVPISYKHGYDNNPNLNATGYLQLVSSAQV